MVASGVAQAQRITISAKIIDKETKEPISFASVGLRDKSIGTVSNFQGEFDFHLPSNSLNEVLVINSLGYKSYEATVGSLLGRSPLVIEIEKSTIVLEEIMVKDSLKGGDIISIAISRIPKNYPNAPFLMDVFYRDLKKIGGTYVSLLEAAVKIYDEDYEEPRNKNKLRERVSLQEVRRSLGYGNKFTTYFDEDNLLENLLLDNDVRYRNFPQEELFFENLVRERDSYYSGHEIFVVTLKANYSLKIYVDKETYGIIHLEYENNLQSEQGKKRGLVSRFEHVKRIIDFKPFQGKLYLNYMQSEQKLNWYDVRTNELKFETELLQQLLINEVVPNTEERIGTTERMRGYGLQYQDLPYNKEFWDNYNVIKESPLDRKIIDDLEKAGPLSKQFENKRP
jgi:hypothetical protein